MTDRTPEIAARHTTAAPLAPSTARCDVRCWTQVTCSVCGRRKQPRGRSVPLAAGAAYCDGYGCDGYGLDPRPPHLWDEHDDARRYTDPDGWANHVANCDRCGGSDD